MVNSSEVKKIVWFINVIVVCVLGMVVFFVYKQLSKPAVNLKPFVYSEPIVTEKFNSSTSGVTRGEVENVFGWKPPAPPAPPAPPIAQKVEEVKPVVQKSNVNNLFELQTILGRLAFILIKKDKLLKSVVIGDDIMDANGEVMGVLKEVREDSVLILLNGKIESLMMEGLEPDAKAGASLTPAGTTSTGVGSTTATTALVPSKTKDASKAEGPKPAPIVKPAVPDATITNTRTGEVVAVENGEAKKVPEEVAVLKGNFDGVEFEFTEGKDADGITHRKIPEDMAAKLQSKENIKKFTNSNNYDLVFQADGVLIKNIKDPEVKKFFAAFGITDSDIILSVNGQSLGNKTEDDLIALYQQIVDSAKYATIELLKNGVRQKYRVSTDRIKKPVNK